MPHLSAGRIFEDVKLFFESDFPYFVQIPPATLPITLAQVKSWLKLDPNETFQDEDLTLLIETAATCCQEITRRILITTTFLTLRNSFARSLPLLRSPFQSLVSFKYTVSDALIDVPSTVFYTTRERDYSKIILKVDENYPQDGDNILQGIKIQFVAGYGNTSANIPTPLLLGMRNHIAALYENRGDCDLASVERSLPNTSRATYNKFRILELV